MPNQTGWRFLRLSPHDDPGASPGKRPLDLDWPNRPPPNDETVDQWLADGFNIGIATGHGFVVVDIDLPEIPPEFPETLTVRTGSGRWHLYYSTSAAIRNSAGKLGKHIDVRGVGGQVVAPPSLHATGGRYTWFKDIPMRALPEWIEKACGLSGKWIEVDWAAADRPVTRAWGRVALERECAKVAGTGEGARNDQLFKSAAALWEIVNGGALGEPDVSDALATAAAACGLPENEARAVIASARKRTAGKERKPKERAPAAQSAPIPDAMPPHLATLLIPGPHVDDHGEYHEVTPHDFATTLLACQPAHTIFVRGGAPGLVRAGAFAALSAQAMRIMLQAKPYKWVTPRPSTAEPEPKPRKVYVALTKEHAELAIARAVDHANVGEIRLITYAPMFGAGGLLSRPGWNSDGLYQSGPAIPEVSPHDLRDLLIDFPWKSEADRQNFIGLLITILVRAMIPGNVPMHLVLSTVERTGKTKLVDELIGLLFLGGPVPAMQFSGSDEERDKRILAVLMLGLSIVHLDNLGEWLDSPALASSITASVYSGRLLGQSAIVHVPNLAVWIGTGNNVSLSGEMAKRTVPIGLLPTDADPHLRTEFVHPDLRAYVLANRDGILTTLIGMVTAWDRAGRPQGSIRVGGFEGWSAIVGGVMAHAGYDQWMANYAAWTGAADVEGADMIRFMENWQLRGGMPERVGDLRKQAVEMGLFERRLGRASSDRGLDSAFGSIVRRYIKRAVTTSYGKFCIVEQFLHGVRQYRMERR